MDIHKHLTDSLNYDMYSVCKHPIRCTCIFTTSGDENNLCGASLRKSHKISLKAHWHACAHGVGTPIAI